jgi:hypothetical protein
VGQRGHYKGRGYIFFLWKRKVINWEQDYLYTTDYFQQLKRVEFVSDRLLYIALIGRWCNIIVLSAHAPTEKRSDELRQVFDYFPEYHMKIMLGDFIARFGREDIFKPTILNDSLHQESNDNGVRILHFTISKNLGVKSMMFLHQNIHKYNLTCPDGDSHTDISHTDR